MGRNRGAAPRPAVRAAAPARAPAPQQHAPPPQHHQQAHPPAPPMQSAGPGLMGMVAQGMALGAGSEVGHQAVRSLMGGGSSHQAPAPAPVPPAASMSGAPSQSADACAFPQQDLYKCLQSNSGNANSCQYYFDALKSCQEMNTTTNAQF